MAAWIRRDFDTLTRQWMAVAINTATGTPYWQTRAYAFSEREAHRKCWQKATRAGILIEPHVPPAR